jgi:transposase
LARYAVDAVLLEGRSAREVAAAHGISKSSRTYQPITAA